MIITLTGNNHFLVTQKLQEIVNKFAKQYGDLAVERLDGEESETQRINESLQNLPFLIEKKLVVLRDPSKNKEFTENIEQIISSIPETTEAVIVESKIDKRQAYYKALKAKTDYSELDELDAPHLTSWIAQEVKVAGGNISFGDANYLVERVGANQQLLFNEIQKLISYDKSINRQSIDLLTELTPDSTIFNLLDATFGDQTEQAMQLYDEQRRMGVEPAQIMSMIAWQLHILALVKAAGNRSQAAIAKEARISPYVVQKSLIVTQKLNLSELKKLINNALKLDVKLKSQTIDADEALKHFLLSLGR